jgi:hypothetical protein
VICRTGTGSPCTPGDGLPRGGSITIYALFDFLVRHHMLATGGVDGRFVQ